MDSTLIGVIVTVGLAGVVFIVWLVRLEGKTNTNNVAREENTNKIIELKKEHELEITILEKEFESKYSALKDDFWRHVADVKAHHNAEAFTEFRSGIERRLGELDFHIKDVGRKLNHMVGRE